MKVICINAENINLLEQQLIEGETYTVIGDSLNQTPSPGYLLAEVRHSQHPLFGYKKIRFIPLSEIDETELVNQREVECL